MQFSICEEYGSKYFITENRGILYHIRKYDGEWEVHSHRKSLGNRNIGTYKFFKTLEELEKQVKSFRGISQIIGEELAEA